ncbi:FAD-binding protein [Jatrophihabitans cynanchi]|uniref:FAD-binding protein n=1 Tax=Jatrophihabitans cynanchi TaxID=2944128 RepID=A0ABY7K502_9ACTN|nr:FAD-binding protein [Jatrophihabitans sp. SB3-54]
MAGLTAAARASAAGCQVALVEKAQHTGGSAAMSGGVLWQPASRDLLRAVDPSGEAELVDVFFDRFPEALAWVRATGVEVGDRTGVLGYGVGQIIDIIGYLRACERQVRSSGGWVVTGASVDRLVLDGDAVTGAVVTDRDGTYVVEAKSVLLATGGFQGDPGRRRQYLGSAAETMLLRSNPVSAGDGLRLGLAAGAATSEHMNGFYGHLMISPLSALHEADFVRLSQWYCTHSIVVNLQGERITDESRGYALCAQAAIAQPEPRVAVLFDERVRSTLAVGSTGVQGLEVVDRLAEAQRVGGRIAQADTWEALAQMIGEWGFDGSRSMQTVETFNLALGSDEVLSPPRDRYRTALDEGPFFAVEAQPAITFSMGGLRIDKDARVLRADGQAIDGLLAAGADSGGTFAHGYGGGLALGSVFGTVAAEHAVRRAGRVSA